jgi:hypothetical protein
MLNVLRGGRHRQEDAVRMKLKDMDAVQELAARRDTLLIKQAAFQAAAMLDVKTVRERLTTHIATGLQEAEDDENAVLLFAALRQALSDYFERELSAIDKELRALGVEA